MCDVFMMFNYGFVPGTHNKTFFVNAFCFSLRLFPVTPANSKAFTSLQLVPASFKYWLQPFISSKFALGLPLLLCPWDSISMPASPLHPHPFTESVLISFAVFASLFESLF